MRLPLSLALVFGFGYTSPAVTQAPQVQGTFDLFVCRNGCQGRPSSRAYVRATVVLMERPLRPPDDSVDVDPTWKPNGCFFLSRKRERSDSYAGLEPRGLLTWRSDSVAIWFDLYRSPDAGYRVVVVASAAGYSGRGDSWGDGAAEITAPTDSIEMVRIGPAQSSACQEAFRP